MKSSDYVFLFGGSICFLMVLACGAVYSAHAWKLQVRRPFWDWSSIYRLVWDPSRASAEEQPVAYAARRAFLQALIFIGGFGLSMIIGGTLRSLGH
jgi:hypothetical protein